MPINFNATQSKRYFTLAGLCINTGMFIWHKLNTLFKIGSLLCSFVMDQRLGTDLSSFHTFSLVEYFFF